MRKIGLVVTSVVQSPDLMTAAENPNLKPTPDDFLTIIRRQQLGKLKIYLGPSPGVGKTYQMLVEGNRLRRQGVDVVIGYVEPHDRARDDCADWRLGDCSASCCEIPWD